MVRRSTGLTAEVFGIPQRGVIKVGNYADIIAFRPEEVRAEATYSEPAQLSKGMHLVIVNGVPVVKDGVYNGKLVGRGLTRD